jgi:hypothetical protein
MTLARLQEHPEVSMKMFLPLMTIVLLGLFAYVHSEDYEMVGTWVGTRTPSHVLAISQNGNKFVIEEDLKSSNGEKLPHHEFVGTYQNGTLFFKHPAISQPMQITYLKDFDFLNFDGQTFKRSS